MSIGKTLDTIKIQYISTQNNTVSMFGKMAAVLELCSYC